jgi:transcription initiation factor TFIID subunit TAF12
MPKALGCNKGCGQTIWFDWGKQAVDEEGDLIGFTEGSNRPNIPLQVDGETGEFLNQRHDCPNYQKQQQQQQQQQQQPQSQQPKADIPASGPKPGDWETKIGLLNGQVFMRLDRIDENIRKIFVALGFAASSDSNTESPATTTE